MKKYKSGMIIFLGFVLILILSIFSVLQEKRNTYSEYRENSMSKEQKMGNNPSKGIMNLAKSISEPMGDYIVGLVVTHATKAEILLNKKDLPQSGLTNLYFESIYFSIDYMSKRLPDTLSKDEKESLVEELHKNMLNSLITMLFSPEKNRPGYEEKIRKIYYETLQFRNTQYGDPKNESRVLFGEILSEEFKDAGLKIDKSFFDSLSADIIDKLNTIQIKI